MPLGVVVLTPHNGRIVRVNGRFARWVGRTQHALKSQPVSSCRWARAKGLRQFQGLRVLLVDDNATIRDILTQLLGLAGVVVDSAAKGHIALTQLQSSRCALVLMDMQMPFMDGLQATQQIRQDPSFQDLPIVALTAGGFEEDRDRCLAAGMSDDLSKPFEFKKRRSYWPCCRATSRPQMAHRKGRHRTPWHKPSAQPQSLRMV